MSTSDGELRELQTFVVQLGAAINAVSVPVFAVQERLQRVAAAYGATGTHISAFPTSLLVTMGRGESATLGTRSGLGLACPGSARMIFVTRTRRSCSPTESGRGRSSS